MHKGLRKDILSKNLVTLFFYNKTLLIPWHQKTRLWAQVKRSRFQVFVLCVCAVSISKLRHPHPNTCGKTTGSVPEIMNMASCLSCTIAAFSKYGHISHYYDEKYKWENVGHKLIIKIDQQSTLFLLLSWPTFPLSGKLVMSMIYSFFTVLKNLEFKLLHAVCIIN